MGHDSLSVDPDRLEGLASPYQRAAEAFHSLRRQIDGIKARYADAWGDDDLGRQVRPRFDKGVDGLRQRVDVLGRTLDHYSSGLQQNARAFRDADDDAQHVTRMLNGAMPGVAGDDRVRLGAISRTHGGHAGEVARDAALRAESEPLLADAVAVPGQQHGDPQFRPWRLDARSVDDPRFISAAAARTASLPVDAPGLPTGTRAATSDDRAELIAARIALPGHVAPSHAAQPLPRAPHAENASPADPRPAAMARTAEPVIQSVMAPVAMSIRTVTKPVDETLSSDDGDHPVAADLRPAGDGCPSLIAGTLLERGLTGEADG